MPFSNPSGFGVFVSQWGPVRGLSNNFDRSLKIPSNISAPFPIAREVRQVCFLSPLLTLSQELFLVALHSYAQTSQTGAVCVSFYTDGITSYLRDTGSLRSVPDLYKGCKQISGTHLKLRMCKALRIGGMFHSLREVL